MGIRAIQSHIGKVLSGKNLTLVTPVNLNRERNRFITAWREGSCYEPVFSYRPIRFDTGRVQEEIDAVKSYDGQYKEVLHAWAERCQALLDIVRNRGTPGVTTYAKKLYGEPPEETFSYAQRILSGDVIHHGVEEDGTGAYAPEAVKEMFEPLIKHIGWQVSVVDMPSKMKIRYPEKTLFIRAGTLFSEAEIRRLKFHEIGTHLQRYLNTMVLPSLIRDCFDHIETEEGLAVVMEDRNGALSSQQLRVYAARAVAVSLSLSHSFSEVFGKLLEYDLDEETAFSVTVRAKRGLGDTGMPGSFVKDHIYLTGKLRIEEYLADGGLFDDLFIGKVGLDDIPLVKDILKGQTTRFRPDFLAL